MGSFSTNKISLNYHISIHTVFQLPTKRWKCFSFTMSTFAQLGCELQL